MSSLSGVSLNGVSLGIILPFILKNADDEEC